MRVEDEEPGVAAGGCPRDGCRPDRARAARPILDQHRRVKALLQPRLHHAGDGIDRAAGRKRHDDAHDPGGPALGARRERRGGGGENERAARQREQDPPCNSRPADSGMMLGAVAGGRPCPPRASSPQWELGSPPVVSSTSNSRLGRKSPVAQGRGSMEMKAVGIDVSKDRLDVHVWPDGIAFAVARDGKGLAELIERLLPLTPDLVVVEATGGFETVVAAALAGAGLPLVVANPAQTRPFAQAPGTRAKTDPIDAAMIARFGHDMKPDVRPLPDEATQLLADLVARRRQIIEMIVAERNRERRATVRRIKKSIARLVRALEKELAEIDAEIDAGVRGSPAWRDKEDLLASVPASDRSSPEPSSPSCPSSALSTRRRSPASPALRPTPASPASGRARA